MIDLGEWNRCFCKKYENDVETCVDHYTVREKGKTVKLIPRTGEQAAVVVLDGCVIQDNDTKCDALFLHQGAKKHTVLVELKGAGEIEKAFAQLAYTQKHRPQYRQIVERFGNAEGPQHVWEKFVIVTNGQMSKPERKRLNDEHDIYVHEVLHSEPISPVPDLREIL